MVGLIYNGRFKDESERILYDLPFTPMCGWDWLEAHKHDMDNFKPKIIVKIRKKAGSPNA